MADVSNNTNMVVFSNNFVKMVVCPWPWLWPWWSFLKHLGEVVGSHSLPSLVALTPCHSQRYDRVRLRFVASWFVIVSSVFALILYYVWSIKNNLKSKKKRKFVDNEGENDGDGDELYQEVIAGAELFCEEPFTGVESEYVVRISARVRSKTSVPETWCCIEQEKQTNKYQTTCNKQKNKQINKQRMKERKRPTNKITTNETSPVVESKADDQIAAWLKHRVASNKSTNLNQNIVIDAFNVELSLDS